MMRRKEMPVTIKYFKYGRGIPSSGEQFVLERGGSGYILHQYHNNEWADDLAQYPQDLVEEKENFPETLKEAIKLVAFKS